MLLNAKNLANAFTGFNTSFNKGFDGAASFYKDVAMVVPSVSRENTYAWLGQWPNFREWLGDRVLQNLTAHSYTLKNKKFENTVPISRDDFEDDQYGIFGPMFEEMGRLSKQHPDELVFSLLKNGFTEKCYDGQNFFDTDHPVKNADGTDAVVSNYQAGAGAPWFMLDCSRGMKPMIFQERTPYAFSAIDKENDEGVFMRDEYMYGIRARVNAGLGLWQLAYASKDDLDHANFSTVRAAMRGIKGDKGRPLGIKPTHLVVPPSLEEAARNILETDTRVYEAGGGSGVTNVSNPWRGSLTLIVTEWLG